LANLAEVIVPSKILSAVTELAPSLVFVTAPVPILASSTAPSFIATEVTALAPSFAEVTAPVAILSPITELLLNFSGVTDPEPSFMFVTANGRIVAVVTASSPTTFLKSVSVIESSAITGALPPFSVKPST